MPPDVLSLPPAHRARLRQVWRSAGWPCQDMVEVELLAAGLLERVRDAAGRDTLRVTDAGVQALDSLLRRNRGARSLHEQLVLRVAREMQRSGRIAWCGLALRAPLAGPDGPTQWAMAMPDVYSIRHTSVEDYVEPIVHEIKVRRADLLADLRTPHKRAAYLALSSQCWYVLKAGIGTADDVPPECGVLVAEPGRGTAADEEGSFGGALQVMRPAPRRSHRIAFSTWMALARSAAEPGAAQPDQWPLAPA